MINLQLIIYKHRMMFRILDGWTIRFDPDHKYANKCIWNKNKKEATICPLTLKDVNPDHYVIHELLHICQAAKRVKDWKQAEEIYVQDMTEIIFNSLVIAEESDIKPPAIHPRLR